MSATTSAPVDPACLSAYRTRFFATPVLSLAAVARRLGMTPAELTVRLDAGSIDIPCLVNGHEYRFRADDVEAWIAVHPERLVAA